MVVLDKKEYAKLAEVEGLSADLAVERHSDKLQTILVKRIVERLREFPSYAKIPRVAVLDVPWTIESGLMTPTLKLRRQKILETCQSEIDWLYAGH